MKRYFLLWVFGMIIPILTQAQGDIPHSQRIYTIGENQTINCTSDSILIGVEVDNWVTGFVYSWNDGATDSVRFVKPEQSTTYVVSVSHPQLNISADKSILVEVINLPIEAADDRILIDKFTCPGLGLDLSVAHSGGHEPFTYLWNNGATASTTSVSPINNENYTVTISDQCGSEVIAEISVSFEPHDELLFSDLSLEFTCENDEVELQPDLKTAKGGVGYGYRFTFDNWSNENTPIKVMPSEDKTIQFSVTDACGINQITREISFNQLEIELPKCDNQTVCSGTEIEITSLTDGLYYWENGTMHASYTEVIEQPTVFELNFLDECGDMHAIKKLVELKEIDSDFDYEIFHFDGKIALHSPAIEAGDVITWKLNGEIVSHEANPELELLAGIENEVELTVEDQEGCFNSSSRRIVLRDGIDIPTAFSPNGDGLNDFFSVTFEEELKAFSIKIFDRWGQLIYNSSDQYFRWTGLHENESETLTSFVYLLKATTVSDKQIEKRGTISAFDR